MNARQRISLNLKKLLKKTGHKKIEHVAFGAKIGKSSLSRILNGRTNPTVDTLEKIANFIQTDIKNLFK